MPAKTVKKKSCATTKKHFFKDYTCPSDLLKVCIILPAKNEAENIAETLSALQNQLDGNGGRLNSAIYEVLLLVNNSTDDTLKIARHFALQHPSFRLQIAYAAIPRYNANIGFVRKILMDEACERLCLSGTDTGIIASTDSDTVVDTHWVNNIINEIANGYDAVGGRILTNQHRHAARRYYLQDTGYRLLAVKAAVLIEGAKNNTSLYHHQFFGASMAITCGMYKRCGRLPEVTHLEDMALLNSLEKIDANISYSSAVKVYTSARTNGRVSIGFSEQLKKWEQQNKENITQFAESAAALIIKLECKTLLQECFKNYRYTNIAALGTINKIAEKLMIDKELLKKLFITKDYFGQLWKDTEAEISKGEFNCCYPPEPITHAIKNLRIFLHPK